MSYAKIASQKPASSSSTRPGGDASSNQWLTKHSNSLLRVTLGNLDTFDAALIGYDPASRTAVFQQHGQEGANFRFVVDTNITKLQVIRPLKEEERAKIAPAKKDRLEEKERTTVKRFQEAIESANPQASDMAQYLFDEIKKTYPCVWSGQSIVVMDRVRIDPPYDEAHVSGVDGNVPPTEVSRVKYVLSKSQEKQAA